MKLEKKHLFAFLLIIAFVIGLVLILSRDSEDKKNETPDEELGYGDIEINNEALAGNSPFAPTPAPDYSFIEKLTDTDIPYEFNENIEEQSKAIVESIRTDNVSIEPGDFSCFSSMAPVIIGDSSFCLEVEITDEKIYVWNAVQMNVEKTPEHGQNATLQTN